MSQNDCGRCVSAAAAIRRTLDALDAAGKSYGVANVATQPMLVLEVFERHIDDLRDGYLDADGEATEPKRWVPFETVLGPRGMPAEAAAIVARAIDKMIASGDATKRAPWRAVELLCADYLAGE